jgi:pyruvate/2-oxoglutarate dehydrogenase complex dihydrolipoamide acyltransferase (E2) component
MVDIVSDPRRWNSAGTAADAKLESWLVEEGEHVNAGQLVAHASLAQQNVDVKAPDAGVVEQIAVSAGESFGPGYILARLAAD